MLVGGEVWKEERGGGRRGGVSASTFLRHRRPSARLPAAQQATVSSRRPRFRRIELGRVQCMEEGSYLQATQVSPAGTPHLPHTRSVSDFLRRAGTTALVCSGFPWEVVVCSVYLPTCRSIPKNQAAASLSSGGGVLVNTRYPAWRLKCRGLDGQRWCEQTQWATGRSWTCAAVP